jgi:hypothetical protein
MTPFTGGCLCGNVRYRADAEPLWLCHCHCSNCRKLHGSPIGTYVGFPAGTVSWLAAEPTRYRSSKDVERSFCPVCGSRIGFHRVHETSLAVGSFDAPEALPVADIRAEHVWFKEHVPWFDTADEWPRISEFPSGRAEELNALSGKAIEG